MTKLLSLAALALTFTFALGACSNEEEEESSTSESALKCPSPVDDREGFIACVKNKASSSDREGRRSGSSGNGGTSSSSQNGGDIQIGDINSGGNSGSSGRCSSLSITCRDDGCVCRGNGGPEQACDGSNCQAICCP